MVTATPHEDVEAAYGADREEQLLLDIMRDAALCCRERHTYLPSSEDERSNFTPHLWVMEGATEYANHAYAEGRTDESKEMAGPLMLMRDAFDLLESHLGDSEVEYEDDDEEREYAPVQVAARLLMAAILAMQGDKQ